MAKSHICIYVALLLSIVNFVYGNTISCQSIIELVIPEFEERGITHGPGQPAVYQMRCLDDELILTFLYFSGVFGPEGNDIFVDQYAIIRYHVQTKRQTDPQHGYYYNYSYAANPLIFDASYVLLNDQRIILENAYLREIYTSEGGYHSYENSDMELIFLSHQGSYIGGTIKRSYFDDISSARSYSRWAGIWETATGKNIVLTPLVEGVFCYPLIEGKFSRNDDYSILRYMTYISFNEPHTLGPAVLMYKMRMNPPQKYQAERDVAFTSDERWLVTERDGVPTLVDAETGADLQRYDIGEKNIMTAACFSPDDQKLYIAGIDRKIYVFDSHLPSNAAGWEVYP